MGLWTSSTLWVLPGQNAFGSHFDMWAQFLSLTGPQGEIGQHLEWRRQTAFGIAEKMKQALSLQGPKPKMTASWDPGTQIV